ncbi:gp33 [Bacillus phage SPO1]|uniref:Gene 33 protein n=4 Tax=Okubovirus TaxID=1857845 RepID=GP33_BPSP1|nr:gp33 [Bacillus phage SPO1]YP_008770091.1 hypothetical protein CampHawk_157 [Bacillus phage CampHawk]P06226.1 RecName: Full=Gene 33 protein [Bacillus phage SPO1]APZ82393.1 sigma factor accessory [Bacillus phage vB_BsuM-Goe2]UNY49110.1 hypothetical protein sp82g_173 [Bacillus phage SP82G]WCS68795.1 hypothetical protein Goe19_01540 [Bacillus phage vB_BsuM-Goe19]WIT26490.1 hypothetical protein [Bacillus phage SPO1L4]ACI91058.1 gp33 [Bacillus phage SPO1]
MQKFLDELEKVRNHTEDYDVYNSEAERTFRGLKAKFQKLIGKRALYICKSTKESRVVTIEAAYDRYIVLSYKYYGMDYEGSTKMSVTYQALLSGEDRLDVE